MFHAVLAQRAVRSLRLLPQTSVGKVLLAHNVPAGCVVIDGDANKEVAHGQIASKFGKDTAIFLIHFPKTSDEPQSYWAMHAKKHKTNFKVTKRAAPRSSPAKAKLARGGSQGSQDMNASDEGGDYLAVQAAATFEVTFPVGNLHLLLLLLDKVAGSLDPSVPAERGLGLWLVPGLGGDV